MLNLLAELPHKAKNSSRPHEFAVLPVPRPGGETPCVQEVGPVPVFKLHVDMRRIDGQIPDFPQKRFVPPKDLAARVDRSRFAEDVEQQIKIMDATVDDRPAVSGPGVHGELWADRPDFLSIVDQGASKPGQPPTALFEDGVETAVENDAQFSSHLPRGRDHGLGVLQGEGDGFFRQHVHPLRQGPDGRIRMHRRRKADGGNIGLGLRDRPGQIRFVSGNPVGGAKRLRPVRASIPDRNHLDIGEPLVRLNMLSGHGSGPQDQDPNLPAHFTPLPYVAGTACSAPGSPPG